MHHGKEGEEQQLATSGYVSKHFVLDKVEGVAKVDEEIIQIKRFATEPAWVNVNLGLTINLGNYESAKLEVGVKVPCYMEEADDAYRWAKHWVESRVRAESSKIKDRSDTSII